MLGKKKGCDCTTHGVSLIVLGVLLVLNSLYDVVVWAVFWGTIAIVAGILKLSQK